MAGRWCLALLALCIVTDVSSAAEEFRVYSDRPRILLNTQRLRRLKRERERQTPRWEQFQTLVEGKAQLPEPGFSLGLYYAVTGREQVGRQAVQWAIAATDTRQVAMVFDWCRPLFSEAQAKTVGERLKRAAEARTGDSVVSWRDRAFAALAIADDAPDVTETTLRALTQEWWNVRMGPALQRGEPKVARQELYVLFEMLHTLRDNLNIDLREAAPAYFKGLTGAQLLTYFPSPFPAPENLYRIPIFALKAEPDLQLASLSRAAELEMVAFDSNALESQFLQGWLLDERFTLRGLFGTPYEYLWANPYQPGLSYYKFPLSYHNETTGELYVRSSWDDEADWAGILQGRLQLYRDGKRTAIDLNHIDGMLVMGDVMLTSREGGKWRELPKDVKQVYVTGLTAKRPYELEIDDEEMDEVTSDPAGTAAFPVGVSPGAGFLLRAPQ